MCKKPLIKKNSKQKLLNVINSWLRRTLNKKNFRQKTAKCNHLFKYLKLKTKIAKCNKWLIKKNLRRKLLSV